MDTNGHHTAADNGFDMIDLKAQCIRSIGWVIKTRIYDNVIMSRGTGVFVDHRLLLTCYHVVKHNQFVFVQYVKSYDNQWSDDSDSELDLDSDLDSDSKSDSDSDSVSDSDSDSDSDSKTKSKSRQILQLWPMGVGDVLYVEPHNDLALVRLRDPPSPMYNTSTTMPLTTSPESTDFGSPVALLGHGGNVRYALHPGMVITPQVDNYLIPIAYYLSVVPINEKQPIIAHSTISLHGNSGGPVIDTNGQVCGICWGGIIRRGQISFAIGTQILKEFMANALAYESDGRKHNRLRKRYEWDIRSNTRLLGLILSKQPFSGSFTVQTALPSATNNAKNIIGTNVLKIGRQDFNTIDIIRSAIVNDRVITVCFRYTTDDEDNSQTGRKLSTQSLSIDTIPSTDNHGISIIPLVI
ncbi:uncharacterized protein LOC128955015 [Oppia nitens]|uniref:uncharacterized protein LOC128955015 n=1 Tax=Oppia nitens TaxID=1686743 RepID=UPI0023DAB3D1|nr:uncharacterized protein LOC128955015 [Oppia nitens]